MFISVALLRSVTRSFSGYMKENEGTVACQVGDNKPGGRHSYSFVVLHI